MKKLTDEIKASLKKNSLISEQLKKEHFLTLEEKEFEDIQIDSKANDSPSLFSKDLISFIK
ncbi:hypothetical protein CU098_009515 [Rhizopus stolonifer]|uniref:Uncharacterized protein n=1 Tax=Rhizopus stolonifer TaxID=4846 RepID=A0A367KR24_RHIST|nr:hypothetical protein CU098_009515 [Rhizopus stolonifer]